MLNMHYPPQVLARVCASALVGLVALTAPAYGARPAADLGPTWVSNSWGPKTHDNGRAIYGVGSAKAQGDVRALRSLAQAEAKAAVLSQLAVFATAVQADASPQGRAIAIGVQAFGPLIEHLVRPMDYYVAADGTHYSLMAVQANTIMAVVQKARDKGLTLAGVDAPSFEAAFDKVAKIDAPTSAIVGAADSSWTDAAIKQDIDKVPRASGPEPAWVSQGASASLPSSIFLCGLGRGKNPSAAVGAGGAALTERLMAPAIAAAAAVDAARAALALSGVRGHDAKDAAQAAWRTVASFVAGQQVWTNQKGNAFAASCVPRVKTYVAIKERLKLYDTQVGVLLDLASHAAAGSDAKKDNLNKAFVSLQERAALAALLRGVNISGLGQAGTYAVSDLAAAQNPVAAPPRLAVSADGPYWLGLANAVVDGVHHPNVVPSLVAVTPQHELLLTAKISLSQNDTKSSKNAKGEYQVFGQVSVALQDLRLGKELLRQTFEASDAAVTHIFDAERAVMRKLNQQVSEATNQALAALP